MAKNKIRTESREEFGQWMCEAHNDVNRKLGEEGIRLLEVGGEVEDWLEGWQVRMRKGWTWL